MSTGGYIFLDEVFCMRLLMALTHFLWQGTVLAVLAGTAGWLLRRRSARAAYAVFCAALAGMAICVPATFVVLGEGPVAPPAALEATLSTPPPAMRAAAVAPVSVRPETEREAVQRVLTAEPRAVSSFDWRPYARYAAWAYLLGVFFMATRLGLGIWGGGRLRRRAAPIEDAAVLKALARHATALGMRVVPVVAVCGRVAVPTVVGVLRPLILLPAALVLGMPPGPLELLILHELAHIRRHDHLVNLLQHVVEALLFFHPAMWYVSRRIRLEREHCCDDLVLAHGGDAKAYAKSLVQAAALAHGAKTPAALAALGATGKPSQLRGRIGRFLGISHPAVRMTRGWWTAVAVLGTVGLAALWASCGRDAEPPSKFSGAQAELAAQTKDPDWWLRKVAVVQLAESGDAQALPIFIATLKDQDERVQAAAAAALGKLKDPSAVKHLVAVLKEKEGVRAAAAEALTQFEPAQVMPLLKLAANDSDVGVRTGAVVALGRIKSPEALPAVLDALRMGGLYTDEGRALLGKSVASLAGMDHAQVLEGLSKMAAKEDEDTRIALCSVLGKLGDPGAAGVLKTILQDTRAQVRAGVIEACNEIAKPRVAAGEALDPALAAVLIAALRDKNRTLASSAATTLGELKWLPNTPEEQAWYYAGTGTWDALPRLGTVAVEPLLAVWNGDWTSPGISRPVSQRPVRPMPRGYSRGTEVIQALGQIQDPGAEQALRDILQRGLKQVEGEGLEAAYSAATALGERKDPASLDLFIAGLQHSATSFRAACAEALGKLKDKRAVSPLLALLTDPESDAVVKAVWSLGEIGDPAAVPDLVALLNRWKGDGNPDFIAEALGKLGGEEALKALQHLLETNSNEAIRQKVIVALGTTHDPRAIPALSDALTVERNHAGGAARALATIGGPEAVQALSDFLRTQPSRRGGNDSEVAVLEALTSIQDPNATDALVNLSEAGLKPTMPMRMGIARALVDRGHPKGKELLEQLRKSPSVELRTEAVRALESAGAPVEGNPGQEPAPAAEPISQPVPPAVPAAPEPSAEPAAETPPVTPAPEPAPAPQP